MKYIFSLFLILVQLNCFSINFESHLLKKKTKIEGHFKTLKGKLSPSNLKYIDCIYVLNLDERPEKWINTKNILKPFNIGFNRFSGINGWKFSDQYWKKFWKDVDVTPTKTLQNSQTYPLSKGKVGCILSHLSIIQDAFNRGFNNIWILQDDIKIYQNPHLIDHYIEKLSQLEPNWDLLFTDTDMLWPGKNNQELKATCITGAYRPNQQVREEAWYLERKNISKDFQEIRIRYGFHSVVLTRKAMERILYYFKHVKPFAPFDIDTHFIPGLKKYGLNKPIIRNSDKWMVSDSSRELNIEKLPSPYNQLKYIDSLNTENLLSSSLKNALKQVVLRYDPKVILNLGSNFTNSIISDPSLMPNNGKVFVLEKWNKKQKVYNQFLSNIIHKKLYENVVIVPGLSDLEKQLEKENSNIDCILIDDEESNDWLHKLYSLQKLINQKAIIICQNNKMQLHQIKKFAKRNKFKISQKKEFLFLKK